MFYIPLELLLDKDQSSIYKLVNLASKRALEIAEGKPPLIKIETSVKPSTLALFEIAEGKIKLRLIK